MSSNIPSNKELSVHDIFNRPPAVSEDTLQYALYPPSDFADRSSVTTLATLIRDYVDALLPGHIWHKDQFELKVAEGPDTDGWMLEGRMRVGDSVDDEWCVVWLLREISKKWDVVISVFDSDGEFLLIEAADTLPSWVTPSNAENRVWIYQSRLHLIPLTHVSAPSSKPRMRRYHNSEEDEEATSIAGDADDEDYLTVRDALSLVKDTITQTDASEQVAKAVWARISAYPEAARQHVHVTKAYVPEDIAKVLAVDLTLIQKPIETFYTRDALQLRASHRMARFPPHTSVLTSVKMTRTAYAQLAGQKFYPPKIFGRWQEREGTPEWKWKDIGMKIACGFEMLYQESKSRAEATVLSSDAIKTSLEARKEALRRQPDYVKYIQNLMSSGYFKGEREESQLWNVLEDKAAEAFIETRRDDDATRTSFATSVNQALARAGDQMPPVQPEDPDDWLNVDAADFDAMLAKTMGSKAQATSSSSNAMDIDKDETEEDRVAKEQASRLQDLAKKVEQFVEGEGDVEGARFADEEFSDEEFSDESSEPDESSSDEEMYPLDDDAKTTERKAALDKLVPGIDPSEYGKMPPSFHRNSQRTAPTTMETENLESEQIETGGTTSEPYIRPIRPPILARDEYEGVDSDDETDEEGSADDEDEEDMPQVVGELEVDMEEEQEEFLEFARHALGMSDEQWGEIVRERESRGAFVPARVTSEHKSKEKQPDVAGHSASSPGKVAPGPRQNNPAPASGDLDSFEAVMQAMDRELGLSHENKQKTGKSDKGKGKASADVDIEAAMDAELSAALEHGEDEEDEGASVDYGLIKNFLESFKSQGGLSGPVSNLASRLQSGWVFPRDESQ